MEFDLAKVIEDYADRIMDGAGREIGRGLVNYSADDLRRIAGMRSEQVVQSLGTTEYEEVVHRDNMVVE